MRQDKPRSTSPTYSPTHSPIDCKTPHESKMDMTELRRKAGERTRKRADDMREKLEIEMLRDWYEQCDREAGRDTLHLSYAMDVLDKAWPHGTPGEVTWEVQELRLCVRKAIEESTAQHYKESMKDVPGQAHMQGMQEYYKQKIAEIAKGLGDESDASQDEMVAALNMATNEEEISQANKQVAVIFLPLFHALYTIEAAFSEDKPESMKSVVKKMQDVVRAGVVREMGGREHVWDATQKFCVDAVCVVVGQDEAEA